MQENHSTRLLIAGACGAALLLTSCAAQRYADKADSEVYDIISAKTPAVPGMPDEFSIEEAPNTGNFEDLSVVTRDHPAFGESDNEAKAHQMSLAQALSLAVKNSRQYQNRKESVYLEGLALTLDRHQFTPIFGADAQAQFERSTRDVTVDSAFTESLNRTNEVITQIEMLTGQPADLLRAYQDMLSEAGGLARLDEPAGRIEDQRQITGDTSVGVNWLLKGGGRIAASLTTTFLHFLKGEGFTDSASTLTATFTQPLLRGAGAGIAAEQLTQAERDMLYALRAFARFRKTFVVDVASQYYGVLRNRDEVVNNWQALQNFERNVARERAFAQEGRRTPAELGRLEQALLSRENAWVDALRRYEENLDRFKIILGLSTDAPIVLDGDELAQLREHGLLHPAISTEDAVDVALAARLDLYTERDLLADASRRVEVAENAFLPQVALAGGITLDTPEGGNYNDLDGRRARWRFGLDVDPDLDRLPERNAYRRALIDLARADRDFTLAADEIKLAVRAAWRNLDQARRNYEIAVKGVELNERRVEEQNLLAELGRATALDQVDAQNDLTDAQNDLTAALISHTLARLAFWRDMGILYVKPNGQWEEVTDAPLRATAQES
ncbi:MAG: TolC family protein [Candidatus Hydrogenedentota bacterium]